MKGTAVGWTIVRPSKKVGYKEVAFGILHGNELRCPYRSKANARAEAKERALEERVVRVVVTVGGR